LKESSSLLKEDLSIFKSPYCKMNGSHENEIEEDQSQDLIPLKKIEKKNKNKNKKKKNKKLLNDLLNENKNIEENLNMDNFDISVYTNPRNKRKSQEFKEDHPKQKVMKKK
jgi:hypothetical protein